MCGFSGFISKIAQNSSYMENTVFRMTKELVHRGPDDSGVWVNSTVDVALAHRRLAVLDLSPHGHQPMLSDNGRYCLVYNGEIYNHLELRREFPGELWRGSSDTETLLACICAWGLEKTLSRIVGMFAFAVWDTHARTLSLARDRFGEKPLYFGRLPCGDFVFASELSALKAHPQWHGEIDRGALALFLRHSAVPAPYSIYSGIRKLLPGTWLEVALDGAEKSGVYWSVARLIEGRVRAGDAMNDSDATERLDVLLSDAVRAQMLADVPLGAFLSGGVDSSLIVALMQKNSGTKARTFTIGFDEDGFDEAVHARRVARHLNTDHTELYLNGRAALDIVPRLANVYDEPFSDSSQIPTLLISELARRHVTVALSGDGGDELFAGYNRYWLTAQLWRRIERFPVSLRRLLSRGLLNVSPRTWDGLGNACSSVVSSFRSHSPYGDKVHKFAGSVLPANSCEDMYRALVSNWQAPESIVLGAKEPLSQLDSLRFDPSKRSNVDWMCLLDQLTYLPDDILVKVDRAAMSVGLETRVPFLDHRVAEFAWQLPMRHKIRNGTTKWLLRQVLYRYVPASLVDRPKQGFSVPLAQWLRGPLRTWAEALLDESRLRSEGIFNVAMVRERWDEHQRGTRNWHHALWSVLMFQAWLEVQ